METIKVSELPEAINALLTDLLYLVRGTGSYKVKLDTVKTLLEQYFQGTDEKVKIAGDTTPALLALNRFFRDTDIGIKISNGKILVGDSNNKAVEVDMPSGHTWYAGDSIPLDSVGSNGDWYWVRGGNIYEKAAGSWVVKIEGTNFSLYTEANGPGLFISSNWSNIKQYTGTDYGDIGSSFFGTNDHGCIIWGEKVQGGWAMDFVISRPSSTTVKGLNLINWLANSSNFTDNIGTDPYNSCEGMEYDDGNYEYYYTNGRWIRQRIAKGYLTLLECGIKNTYGSFGNYLTLVGNVSFPLGAAVVPYSLNSETVFGDTATNITAISLYGMNYQNVDFVTGVPRIYWSITVSAPNSTITLYKDSAKTIPIASGSINTISGGVITLTTNLTYGFGCYGTITLKANSTADTDAGNYITTGIDNAVTLSTVDAYDGVGFVGQEGMVAGNQCWIGGANVGVALIKDGSSAIRGGFVQSSDVVGRIIADTSIPDPPTDASHFREHGHCLSKVDSGTNKLINLVIHHN